MPGPLVVSLPAPLRALGALAVGCCVGLAFAPTQVWLLAVVGLAGLTVLLAGRTLRGAFGYGYLFGVGLTATAISWLYGLGWWIAALLCLVVALFFAGYALAARLAMRVPYWPAWVAGSWLMTEYVYCRFPFGGFGWIRLGFPAVDTPLAGLYPYAGVTGVGLLTAFLAQLVAWCVSGGARRVGRIAATLGVWALAFGAGAVGQSLRPPTPDIGGVVVGVVQGNINGVDPFNPMGRARTVTLNHLSETVTLMARARSGELPTPDLVLWPENSTDVDPTKDRETARIVATASQVADRPILVGAVLDGPGKDERQTAGLWWETDDRITARYYKRNLVPFGEFIPYRDVLLPRFPILELTGAQSVPGTAPGALEVTLPDGRDVVLGDVICFELAWDDTVYDAVRHGAQVLLVQSNNASYGGSPQIPQQWTITRVRAMETGRDVAVATTNSLSGIIRADGSVVDHSHEFEAWSTAARLPLRTTMTPAMTLAPFVEVLGAAMGVAGTIAGLAQLLVARRSARRVDADPAGTLEGT